MEAGQCIQCTKGTCTVRSYRQREWHREDSRGSIGRDEDHVCEALPPLRERHETHVLVRQMDILSP